MEFLKQLEQLLRDIPEEERKEALRYYEDYFDDAVGVDEDKLIAEIGTPEKVARQIKINLYNKSSNEAGVYTENGYSNAFYKEAKKEISVVGDTKSNNSYGHTTYNDEPNYNAQPRRTNNTWLIVLLIVTCPVWGSVLFGLAVGAIATVFGLVVGFGATFIGLLIGAVCCIGFGIVEMFVQPLAGLLLVGVGLILLAVSICFFCLAVVIITKLLPAIVNGIRYLIDKLFNRKER